MAVLSFIVLMATSAGYAVLETARDALLVVVFPRRQFGIVYIAVAVCALPVAALLSHVARRWAPRMLLSALLLLSAGAILVHALQPIGRVEVAALYVTVGLIATAVFPQFWVLVGTALTVGQSRRLLGPIGSAGVLGGLVGTSFAAATIPWLPLGGLLTVGSATLALAAGATLLVPTPPFRPPVPAATEQKATLARSVSALREEPFLARVAVLVALTTATALVIDYFFKTTVARTVPLTARGPFVARYYAAVNALALLVQLVLSSAIVRGVGVTTAMIATPLISALGGAVTLAAGPLAAPVFALKAADMSLRGSINRVTTELVYLPASSEGRQRAKPLIDGALMRAVQALTAGVLLGLAGLHVLSARVLAAIVVFLALCWLVAAATMRKHYLGQWRQTVSPALADDWGDLELDLPSAELVVEHLGSDDPSVVVAAMSTLVRRGRQGLIPALVLLHWDESVLRRALEIFRAGPSTRTDWHGLARRLVGHPSDRVRIAAISALAAKGELDSARLSSDAVPAVRGYAALHAAIRGPSENLVDDPRVAAALHDGDAARTGLLVAIADAEPSVRVSNVLLALADFEDGASTPMGADLLVRATVRQGEVRMVPRLLEGIAHAAGREAIRGALVALGEPAFVQVAAALEDTSRPRRLRIHLSETLGRFGTPAAAERLLDRVEQDPDGLIRYKALRALGRVVADQRIRVDRARVERSVRTNLVTYFGLLGLRVALGTSPRRVPGAAAPASAAPGARDPLVSARTAAKASNAFRLLTGLLDDKLRQSLERAFRLLKIAHPKEDIHRVYLACIGTDKGARANAAEFLDALLRRGHEQVLRRLLGIVSDDLTPAEQVDRVPADLGLKPPRSATEAIDMALADRDIKVAALAALYAATIGEEDLAATVQQARTMRPSLSPTAHQIFREALPPLP